MADISHLRNFLNLLQTTDKASEYKNYFKRNTVDSAKTTFDRILKNFGYLASSTKFQDLNNALRFALDGKWSDLLKLKTNHIEDIQKQYDVLEDLSKGKNKTSIDVNKKTILHAHLPGEGVSADGQNLKHQDDTFKNDVFNQNPLNHERVQLSSTAYSSPHTDNQHIRPQNASQTFTQGMQNQQIDKRKQDITTESVHQYASPPKDIPTTEKQDELSDKATIEKQRHEINELKDRLSKMAGDRLREGNSAITDLSDKNRPTKIAERFSELYDNEWSNAFEYLTKQKKKEPEVINILAKDFDGIYKKVKNVKDQHFQTLCHKIFAALCPDSMSTKPTQTEEQKVIIKRAAQDMRKECSDVVFPAVEMELFKMNNTSAEIERNPVLAFQVSCAKVSWAMLINDPPLHIEWAAEGSLYQPEMYKEYTKKGNKVAFKVWPALLLHENGPLLCRGVVQPQ